MSPRFLDEVLLEDELSDEALLMSLEATVVLPPTILPPPPNNFFLNSREGFWKVNFSLLVFLTASLMSRHKSYK